MEQEENISQTQEPKQISVGELYLSYAEEYIKYMGKIRGIDNPVEDKEFYQK